MKKIFKWIGIIFGAFVALVIVVGIFADPTPSDGAGTTSAAASSPAPAAAPKPAPEPAVAPLAVSVSKLFGDYGDNEVAADQKYKGKRLVVSGTVQSIEKDLFNNIVIRLRTSNEFMPVMAYFDDEQMAAVLKKGAKVTWTCDGAGMTMGSPVLRKCAPA